MTVGRRGDGLEDAGLDRGAHHPDRERLQLLHVAHRLLADDVPDAAPAVADQHHVGLGHHVVRGRLQGVAGRHHLLPVVEVAEQEGHVHEGGLLGEGRHVGGGDDRVVHRQALAHVGEVVLLQPQLAVPVEDEVHRLPVVLLDQLGELEHGLVEGVVVVELAGALQGDGLGSRRRRRRAGSRPGGRRRRTRVFSWAILLVRGVVGGAPHDTPTRLRGAGALRAPGALSDRAPRRCPAPRSRAGRRRAGSRTARRSGGHPRCRR